MKSAMFLQVRCLDRVHFYRGRLFALLLAIVVFSCFARTAGAVEPFLSTERQQEIISELETFRPPGETDAGLWMLGEWNVDRGLSEVVQLPYGGQNAASRFKLLEDLYLSEKDALERGDDGVRGVDVLLEAADMGTCRLIPDYYPVFDSTEARQPDFHVLRLYLQALLRRAEKAAAQGAMRDAERCYRAALVCGWHLTRDKSSSIVFVTGLIFTVRGAQGYVSFLLRSGNAAKVEKVKEYSERVAGVMRAFMWKSNVALSELGDFACLPAVIRVAKEDAEVFWRKEAVVRLATLRYGVPDAKGEVVRRNPVCEQTADEALAEVASTDSDESVRRLAVWAAMNVTPRDYVGMRHDFF